MRPASSWPRSWALCSRCRLRECYSGLRLVARPCQRMAQEPVQPDGDPQDVDGKPSGAVASEAFGSMRMIIATLTTPARVDELALAAWCLVHGYATLCIENGLEDERRRSQRARMFARMLRKDADGCGEA